SKITEDARLDYCYDDGDRVLAIERQPSALGRKRRIEADQLSFRYDLAGRLLEERGVLGPVAYQYDALGNLTQLTTPEGRTLNQLHYGSGHVHQINLDGTLISDIERDALHQEVLRTQGALTSRFHYDGLGRKTFQAAMHLSHADTLRLIQQKEHLLGLPEHPKTWLNRVYYYSKGGEVEKTQDMLRGINAYRYDAAGNLRSRELRHSPVALPNEDFSYDAPGNISLSAFNFREAPGNRLSGFGSLEFSYDSWGNLSRKGYGNQGSDTFQRFQYDCENRLIHAR
ncbi:MAG: RHS repeat domain-containing protein, partial [Pseudomonas sp.]